MRVARLLTCLVLGACWEPAGPAVSPAEGETLAAAPSRAPTRSRPAAPRPRPKELDALEVRGQAVTRGSQTLATLRPANAPGRRNDDFEAVYDHPELLVALGVKPNLRVAFPAQTPVGSLRQIWASAVAPGATATAVVDGRTVQLRRPRDSPQAILRPRGPRWALYEAGTQTASAATLADLAPAITAVPGLVAIDLLDTTPVSVLADAAGAVAQAHKVPALAFTFRPCVPAPDRMVCIPGGPAIVGYDHGLPEEAPEREVMLSTYYVDKYEVTNRQYDQCDEAGACPVRINRSQKIMQPFVGENQPAMPMDWKRARRYCAWSGKRLPTEWEWEKAARGPDGDLYPWGNEEPTCERAVFRECAPYGCTPYPGKAHRWDCNEHATKPVGSFPAGHYGIFDMAGNGYEWTRSAGTERVEACGGACSGSDPQGECDGAYPCRGRRVLRGGSWYWPKHRTRGSHRRIEKLKTGSHRLGMRCATEKPYLTTTPPMHLATPRASPPLPLPPGDAARALFASTPDDPIEDKPICGARVRAAWGAAQSRGGRSEPTCRDPFPYLMTNEPRSYLWNDYVANLGGGYVGIGSDQNYSTVAAARSQWAWIVDYDPRVVRNHRRVLALIEAAPTIDAFVRMFSEAGQEDALLVLDAAFTGSVEHNRMRAGYLATRSKLYAYYADKRRANPKAGTYGWLRTDDNYSYIRTLVQQGRLTIVGGDLLRPDGALSRIGETARKMGIPIRVYYTSNAPSSWGGAVTDAYRSNVLGLPFDRWSVVLQTNSRGGFKQTGHWHHSLTWGRFHQARLRVRGFDTIPKLLEDRTPGHHGDVTVLGFPTGPAVFEPAAAPAAQVAP